MKKVFSVLWVVALLMMLAVPGMALETDEAAQAAYSAIEAAVIAEFGTDEATGLARFPDEFAGAWYDEEHYLVLALTDLSAKGYYEERSGNPDVIRFKQVKYSLWYLLDIQAEISATYRETEQLGFFLEGAMVDMASNTLQLTVVQGDLEQALAYYTSIYGDAISAVEGEALMELPEDSAVNGELRIPLWAILAAGVVILLVVGLSITLVVLIVRAQKEKKQEKRRQAEEAAAAAARAAKSKGKK